MLFGHLNSIECKNPVKCALEIMIKCVERLGYLRWEGKSWLNRETLNRYVTETLNKPSIWFDGKYC